MTGDTVTIDHQTATAIPAAARAHKAAKRYIFAEEINGQIPAHFFGERRADSVQEGLFRHGE